MPFCEDQDVVRVTAKMTLNSGIDDVHNVYHAQMVFNTPTTDLQVHTEIAARLDAAYEQMVANWDDDLVFTTIETWNVTQDRPMLETAWPVRTTGTGSGAVMAQQCAPLALFNTSAPRSQGRKFLPPVTEAGSESGGALASGALADLVDYVAIMIAAITIGSQGALWGNWSKKYARFAPWISGAAKAIQRTQRRRVQGIGS